jgi:copper chaperone CopZ
MSTNTPTGNQTSTGAETTETFQVHGMTCDHCAHAVTAELDGVADVLSVAVDVPSGQVTVTSTARLTTADVRAAIDEAGYQLA